ncbi:hypothetical protein BJ875DRAFT_387965 [Amylocarpus encephaloides]|uniref:Uncharacterized protein n=1 Tax=Amylocarpus encephaloides TaxID=45428 RepID=A0A9P7Y9C6_9HELO|nr:hypothetical protein BJ875DRAFT_387965 [Amylocarpus encephaloides]
MGEVVAQIGPTLIAGVKTGALALGEGETVSLARKFFGIGGLDKFLSVLISTVKTIIPTIILTFILPTLAMTYAPTLANRQWINGLFWQAFPVYGAICQRLLGLLVKDTTEQDRISNPEADMKYLRRAYWFAAIFGGAANLLLLTFGAGAVWTLLNFKDLKAAKKTPVSWLTIVGALVGGTLVAGPGATMAGMWAWREEILANSADRKKVVKKA